MFLTARFHGRKHERDHPINRRIHTDSALNYDSPHGPARNKPHPHTALHYRHPAHPLPGIDSDMREFGQSGIRKHERELLAANRDEIETLSTTLKLRGDCEGRDMAWHLRHVFCVLVAELPFDS